MDTIFATATGRPPAALAIVRISGPAALPTAAMLAGKLPPARQAGLRTLRDVDGSILDSAIVLTFPAPASFTGEDVVELHCHGGRAVIAAVERRLSAIAQLRRALAGEFTRRAMANGRIDLAEAEGLADLLEAESEDQRRAALLAVEGRVSMLVRGWIESIRALRATIEAELNFDDDLGQSLEITDVHRLVFELRLAMEEALAAPSVERLKTGIRVVLAGPPNAGKSTLLNLLCEREAAIVSPDAGTTRDRIEAPVMRAGTGYVLTDTAGLAEDASGIEAIGVGLAKDAIGGADILLWFGEERCAHPCAIWVQSKSDLTGRTNLLPGRDVMVSASHSKTIEQLWEKIEDVAAQFKPATDMVSLHADQRRRVLTALNSLYLFDIDWLITAECLRSADEALSGILGYGATEEMLNALFGRFCIGK